MYDCVWLCMTIYDYVWLYLTMFDYVRICKSTYDYDQLCMSVYDYEWLCLTMYDYVCMIAHYITADFNQLTNKHHSLFQANLVERTSIVLVVKALKLNRLSF